MLSLSRLLDLAPRTACLFQAVRREIRALIVDTGGATAVMLGVAVVPLGGFVGMALDVTRGFMLRAQLSHALDAAGLAGGKQLFADDMQGIVQRFFDANFPDNYMGATITGPTATANAFGTTLTLNAEAEINTTFMRLLGFDTMTVAASTVIERSIRGMELALVMDVTGSMRGGGKITAMKDAAKTLLDILYAGRETVDDFWVSVVPYAVTVNVGGGRTSWLTGYDPDDFAPTAWKGCIEARPGGLDLDDTPPSGGLWTPHLWLTASDNVWEPVDESNGAQNDGTGPNLGCGPAITPLTDSYTTVWNAVDDLQPWHRGGTMGNIGLAWGWRVLSPSWQGLWGAPTPADMPFAYGEPLMDKVVVMLTDGNNQWYDHPPAGPLGSDYGGYGRLGEGRLGTTNAGDALDEVNSRMSQTCALMKAQGIIIYTITFQLNNEDTKTTYRNCASGPTYYFDSPSNAELETVFRKIGDELSNLRIKG